MKRGWVYSGMVIVGLLVALAECAWAQAGDGPAFVRLVPVTGPKVVASSEDYPGGAHRVQNLVDGNPRTEYSSNGKGTETFVEFDFGKTIRVAGFRHLERNDPATVATSELSFLDAQGKLVEKVTVKHVGRRAGTTILALPSPVAAQRVRWQIKEVGPRKLTTVGGAEITFLEAGESETLPRGIGVECQPELVLERSEAGPVQPVRLVLEYPYTKAISATVRVEGLEPRRVDLNLGSQTVDLTVPAVAAEKTIKVAVEYNNATVVEKPITLKPVRKMLVYLLPHSHVDIGYTALQADVVKKQNDNIDIGLRLIEASKNYPEGARFKWNVEVLWPVENYLTMQPPEKQAALLAAIKSGTVGLDAMYGNILTGLSRPEELIRLCSYGTRLTEKVGVPTIESAMISDVPGYTWSTVTALASAGVKYYSFAPNYFDRMGGTMVSWQNKPFWWQGPDGKTRLLCWCPSRGYALGHLIGDGEALARFMPSYMAELESTQYPYEITHLRWNVHGDNGSPDEKLADVVRDWNAKHESPRLVIATTAEAFKAFEKRYGDQLPVYSGDYTPYWEDGAASSAQETALNRATAERLVQAETLWALRNPGPFPAERFDEAWRNVLLYSEHTWGAHNSISQPDLPFVKDQWRVKQAFALDADKQSRQLFSEVLGQTAANAVDVYNTTSWPRTDLVVLSPEQSRAGDRVLDEQGNAVPSQRLSTGELAFVARNVAPMSARRFRVEAGSAATAGNAKAEGVSLSHPAFTVRINEETGAIASLFSRVANAELVDGKAATALNDYFYLPGSNVKDAQRNGRPKIIVKEKGPLVASLLIESAAPGTKSLVREVRVVDGLDRVELINTIDKQPIRKKEGLHFGFGFQVPDGTVRFDVGLAAVRPEVDQIPAACKNWFSVQRWTDISNDQYGLTWATVDAPLVQLGGMTANLIGSQTDHRVWVQKLDPSQTLYAWVMNNHWHTNYRAEQEGPTVFRFAIRPHRGYSAIEAARFGVSYSQPLVVAPALARAANDAGFDLSTDQVTVTAFKPSDDGKAKIVRLFGAAGTTQQVRLTWRGAQPKGLWLSDTGERRGEAATGAITVPAWGVVTLRVEF